MVNKQWVVGSEQWVANARRFVARTRSRARSSAKAPESTTHYPLPTTHCSSGFTLIELMIVMAIIAILTAIAAPVYTGVVKHAREAVLKEDLHIMRSAIDSYTYDKQKAPQDLGDLVQGGYMKELPKDPFTQRTDTWIAGQSTTFTSIDETQSGGIDDVHSGSQQVSSEGTTYNTW